jgi:nucleoside phosphorylase
LKVLIVEDDAEKLREVAAHLIGTCGVQPDDIKEVRYASAAKSELRSTYFDLLVLDINIPDRLEVEPRSETGVSLLRELVERDIYRRPMHIIGLTALEDAHSLAEPDFHELSFSLISYDRTSDRWRRNLKAVCEHIAAGEFKSPTDSQSYDFDVCIVAALFDPELKAVLDLPWNWEAGDGFDGGSVYYFGTAKSEERDLRVVASFCPRMGMPAAAISTSKMISKFRPRYVIMVGILAGVGDSMDFGDVLIADPSWDYESGKRRVIGDSQKFEAAPHQIDLPPALRGRIDKMIGEIDNLDKIRRGWIGSRINHSLKVRRGPVASGAAVLEDQRVVREIKAQHRKVVGIEMETYGVMLAALEASEPRPESISVKSVCDFADQDKSDDFQAYASYTSARVMAELVEKHLSFPE